MLDNDIFITDDDGKEKHMKIYLTYEDEESKRKFAVVYEEDREDELYALEYDEDGNMFIVEDEDIMELLDEVVAAYEEKK